jgi:hypothetical protein
MMKFIDLAQVRDQWWALVKPARLPSTLKSLRALNLFRGNTNFNALVHQQWLRGTNPDISLPPPFSVLKKSK